MHEIREENLRRIINPGVRGNVAQYARDHEIDAGYISQIFNRTRSLGEKAARTFEAKTGMLYMSLDIRGGITMPNADTDKVAGAVTADMELSAEEKRTLLQMLATYRSIRAMKINIEHSEVPTENPTTTTGKPRISK
ncbi:MAG: hypothetical protein V4628_11705 [Pseudomonadota bacterium]